MHEPLSPPTDHRSRRGQSSSSVVEEVQNPPTESLPITSSIASGILVHEEPPQLSPTASSVLPDSYLPEGRFVQSIDSDLIPRYSKGFTIPRDETSYHVKPLTTVFPYFEEHSGSEQGSPKQDYNPWMPATHPSGALYFFDPKRRLFTDTDMHVALLRDEIEEFYHYLQKILHADQLTIPSNNYDLVLDIMPTEDERIQWSYYYACHDNRCLFWLETYDASYMLSELNGVSSPAHVKHRLEYSYWNHWSLFPVVFEDVMTSSPDTTTAPYNTDDMSKMIELVRQAKEGDSGVQYHTAATTRLLSFFAHWRFLYFHGQKHARLVRDQTVYDKPKRERTLLITLLSPLLFFAPEVHLRDVENLWTDDVIIETAWKSFMTKLSGEWEGVILPSTVILTANVGFLAIPGVVLSNLNGSNITSASQVTILTSPAQIASFLSMEASIGSIVIGLLLARHNRTKQKEDPAGASVYLDQSAHRVYGLEPMAIVFGLPWALLMWSMVIFFIALLLLCFTISNTSTRIFISVMSLVMTPPVVGCILVSRRSSDDGELWHDSLVVLKRSGDRLLACLKHFALGAFGLCYARPTLHIPDEVRSAHSMTERQDGVAV
ncbi:hypothetical protein BJV78DRAFT_544493 [Lactifluus subvellereus]|nr:hypothetical protein BJV78DRAFT_544493 [Lactifluus subvellereus]